MSQRTDRAYTLVELIIVIVVIGVLVSVALLGFGKIQADTRDKERRSNAVILSEALESYYEENGEYPSVASITDANVANVKTKLGLSDSDVLVMPKSPAGTTTSLTASEADVNKLAYNGESVNASETEQCTSPTSLTGGCDQFRLEWIDETGQTQAIDSRHEGRAIAETLTPPTDPAIVVAYVSSVIRATVSGAACTAGTIQYKIVLDTSGTDPDWNTVSWQAGTTKDLAGPVSGTTYYGYAIARCISGTTGVAENPNVAEASFYYAAAGTPVMAATWSGTSAVGTVTAPACGVGTLKYLIEYKIDTTGGLGSWVIGENWTTSPSHTIIGATSSNPRKFNFRAQVRCDNGSPGVPSAYSNTDFVISAPAAPVPTDSSTSTTTTWTWPGVSCPSGTSAVYKGTWRGDYNAYPAMPSTISSGHDMTSTTQGFTYGLRVGASCGTVSSKILSVNSADSTYLRPIEEAPFNIGRGGIKTYRPSGGALNTVYASARMDTVTTNSNCPSGTSRYLEWQTRVNNGSYSSIKDGRTWSSNTPQYFYYASDLNDADEFEAFFYVRCRNSTTGALGSYGTAPYRFDRFGNLHLTTGQGEYQVYCDQSGNDSTHVKDPSWCQTGYTFDDEFTGTCTTISAYCWSPKTAIGSYSWSWSSGYPNSAPNRPNSDWAEYD